MMAVEMLDLEHQLAEPDHQLDGLGCHQTGSDSD